MECWQIVLLVLCCPIWAPIAIVLVLILLIVVLFILLCRYNCHIDFKDNLICSLLWPLMCLGPEKTLKESERAPAVPGFEKFMAEEMPDLDYGCKDVKVAYDDTEVPVWSTRPKGVDPKTLPMIMYFHGGGMKQGHALDASYKEFVKCYGHACVTVTPDYRLSLDGHQYPKAVEDCMAAIREYAPDTPHLMLTGISAGGYLTLITALRCRDEGIPVAHMVPASSGQHIGHDPMTGADKGSNCLCGKANACSVSFYVHCWKELFVAEEDWVSKADKGHDLRTWDYTGLPKCDLIAGSFCVTAAENEEMYAKMQKEGVDVRLHLPRATHAYVDGILFEGELRPLMDSIFLAYTNKTADVDDMVGKI